LENKIVVLNFKAFFFKKKIKIKLWGWMGQSEKKHKLGFGPWGWFGHPQTGRSVTPRPNGGGRATPRIFIFIFKKEKP
jgi:hypothetical protein